MSGGPGILETIGSTPTVRLGRVVPSSSAAVHLKLENLNPGASIKDRVARALLDRAAAGAPQGAAFVAATTGSLGISLALECAARGFTLTAVMPDAMTLEKRATLKLYGTKVELTPVEGGVTAARARARELASPRTILIDQFDGHVAGDVVANTLGAELVATAEADGGMDAFVCGIGTGATVRGVARALATAFPKAAVVGVEPRARGMLHRIQGLGFEGGGERVAGRVLTVDDRDAQATKERLAREEGLLLGISTGANVFASLQVAQELGAGKRVYTLAMDTGERYFSQAEHFR